MSMAGSPLRPRVRRPQCRTSHQLARFTAASCSTGQRRTSLRPRLSPSGSAGARPGLAPHTHRLPIPCLPPSSPWAHPSPWRSAIKCKAGGGLTRARPPHPPAGPTLPLATAPLDAQPLWERNPPGLALHVHRLVQLAQLRHRPAQAVAWCGAAGQGCGSEGKRKARDGLGVGRSCATRGLAASTAAATRLRRPALQQPGPPNARRTPLHPPGVVLHQRILHRPPKVLLRAARGAGVRAA